MGCNFYWKTDSAHIGKRYASGPYCYNCYIHEIIKKRLFRAISVKRITERVKIILPNFIKALLLANIEKIRCPICGAVYVDEPIPVGAALELGFRQKPLQFTGGLHSSSGFIFTQEPEKIEQQLKAGNGVVDEYGREHSPNEFRQILAGCIIKDYGSIGQVFS